MDLKLTAISGPTGIGKTAHAIALAKQTHAEIISFDSRQIYRELNIGVARPSLEELQSVKHHLIAHVSVSQHYSAQDFVHDFHAIISDKQRTTNHFILVGGTGFYLRALEYGLDALPDISEQTRKSVQNEFETKGMEHIQQLVRDIDPRSYSTMEIQNPRRLQRIIEIWREHGLVYSDLISHNHEKKWDIKHIVLDIPRDELYQRINSRVDIMIEMGLEEEVRSLIPYRDLSALQTVGYTEFFDHFDGVLSKAEAIDKIKQHTRNYAKRQITWNKKYITENT